MEKKNHENREERAGAPSRRAAMLAAGPVQAGGLFGAGVPASGPALVATGPAYQGHGDQRHDRDRRCPGAGGGVGDGGGPRAVLAGAGAGTFTLAWALHAVAGELVNVPVSRPRRADRCLKPTEFPWGAAARYAR